MRKGPISVPDDEPEGRSVDPIPFMDEIDLPRRDVIDAGVAKFMELAKLNWPNQEGGFKLTSFDIRNGRQLQVTLGMVYMVMRDKDEQR